MEKRYAQPLLGDPPTATLTAPPRPPVPAKKQPQTMTAEAFVAKLKEWRKNAGMSRREAAELLQVGESTINAWESETRTPSDMAIRAVAPLLQ